MNTGKMIMARDLLVSKQDLRNIRFTNNEILHRGPLGENGLLLKVDRFAFTSNNITYAAVGDTMQYWDFFPAEEGWGRVPCWGFADVIASNCESIKEGERIYGYFPMSTHLVVRAGKVTEAGFYDTADHRRSLPVIYNHYVRTAADPAYRPEYEGLHSLFQPLFATSFLLDDYMDENDRFGTENILLTSASSKTAIALAFLLKMNRPHRKSRYRITGLTSAANKAFVKSLDIYDSVLAYEEELPGDDYPALVVDLAGNKQQLLRLQAGLGSRLKRMIMVGLSHWEERSAEGHLEVENEFFFAPAQAEKRTASWGGAGLRSKMASVYIPFLQASGKWLKLQYGSGPDAVRSVYEDMVNGRVDPSEGWVLSLHESH